MINNLISRENYFTLQQGWAEPTDLYAQFIQVCIYKMQQKYLHVESRHTTEPKNLMQVKMWKCSRGKKNSSESDSTSAQLWEL